MLAGTVTLPSSEISDIFARMKAGIGDSSLLLSSSVMQPVQRRLQQRSHIDLNAEYIERRFKVLMHMPALVRKRLSYLVPLDSNYIIWLCHLSRIHNLRRYLTCTVACAKSAKPSFASSVVMASSFPILWSSYLWTTSVLA